jgi:peroxiredoxin
MLEKNERTVIVLVMLVSAVILISVAIVAMINRQGAEQPLAESGRPDYHELSSEPPAEPAKPDTKPTGIYNEEPLSKVPAETISEPAGEPKPDMGDIIRKARTWGPTFGTWVGKPAPDFTLTDITGKDHKLSDYRGKDVLIIFWATWCGPCLVEIPHLIALRNTVGEDKLAMLAISNESPAIVEKFVANQKVKINYTVLSDPGSMPAPFNLIYSIPCSFFIDPDGKVKLATVGTLSLSAIKDILKAEWPESHF